MAEEARRLLTIPSEPEDSAAFRARINGLLGAADTHVYIDTSFLMWLTKIGTASRQELRGWLRRACVGRVHVPTWAAHEYLKHHVAGTILTELNQKTNEVADLVGRTYSYFRPFVDEAHGDGAEDPSTIRAATRAALHSLDRLTAISRQWHKSYRRHSTEVIHLINELAPNSTCIFDELEDVIAVGAARFAGSVPPGFQDRRKKGSGDKAAAEDQGGGADSNRYGDLMFWRELLGHAKTVGARTIVVLSNDRKNDWHFGRSDVGQIEPALLALKRSWKPVPRAHPVLVMEARLVAGVDGVELLDSPYLAAMLREFGEEELGSFTDVAIVPDGPEPETREARRAQAVKERLDADRAELAAAVEVQGFLFADAPEVRNTRATLSRALLESRKPTDERGEALLDRWRASVEAKTPLIETLSADALDGLDHKALVQLSRELHDRVLAGDPGYEEAMVDLVALLDRIPLNTAASLYLGLLASMYLVRETNEARFPPSSPAAQLLFGRQSAGYAPHAVEALATRLQANDLLPLYVPSVDRPAVLIVLETEPDTPAVDQLRSVKLGEAELLTAAQADPALNLAALFGDAVAATGEAVVGKACELFGLPVAQVKRIELFAKPYALTKMIGFKRPADVSIPKETAGGD